MIKILCIVFIVLIITVLLFASIYIYFKTNNRKAEKVSGGYGTVNEITGSTIIAEKSDFNPYVPIKNIESTDLNIEAELNSQEILLFKKIAENPIYFLKHNKFGEKLYTGINKQQDFNIYQNICKFEKLNMNKIFAYLLEDKFTSVENIQKELDRLLSKYNNKFKKVIGIAQGNTDSYIYLDNNTANKIHIIIENYQNSITTNNINGGLTTMKSKKISLNLDKVFIDNFRSWYPEFRKTQNIQDTSDYINIYPIRKRSINDKMPLISDYGKIGVSRNKFSIADIYPASMNARMGVIIYNLAKQNNLSDEITKQLVALHVLEVYIFNIFGHFAHETFYNSSINDNFTYIFE